MISENYIKEGNAIIAKYCNLKRTKPSESNAIEWWEKQDNSINISHIEYRCFMPKLYFHKYWDWLMPVVYKIGYDQLIIISTTNVQIDDFKLEISNTDNKLQKIWECIVVFLSKLETTKQKV